MAVCKEKPDSLPPLDAIGLEPVDQSFAMTRGGSHGRRSSSTAMPPPSRQASVGLGISGFNKPAVNPFTMGQFSTPTQKMSSEERFAASNRSTSMSSGPAGLPFGRPSPMVRSSSQGGPGGYSSSGRTRTSGAASATRSGPVRRRLARATPSARRPPSPASRTSTPSRPSSCPPTAGCPRASRRRLNR